MNNFSYLTVAISFKVTDKEEQAMQAAAIQHFGRPCHNMYPL